MPNSLTSPISLVLPGTLPKVNHEAINYAIKMGLACHTSIERINGFARKNYFYPDLPKGYQVTQDKTPICYNGHLDIETEQGGSVLAFNVFIWKKMLGNPFMILTRTIHWLT